MNAKSDPTEEERKGGSGHIGKMVFSAGTEQLAIVAYVPEDKHSELVCEEWLKKVLSLYPAGSKVLTAAADYCQGSIAADGDKGIFTLKIREGLFLEDNDDDDDEMVFGDDDFPSA